MTDVLPSPCSPARDEKAPVLECRPVHDAAELAEHHWIRRAVFVQEQRLFVDDDVDAHDDSPLTVHVLGLVGGLPVGAVRLYPVGEDGWWKGDRLAVLHEHRRSQIGRPLVRLAVHLAAARGGSRMTASVQAPNTRFFAALGWTSVGEPFDLLGAAHQTMTIGLSP